MRLVLLIVAVAVMVLGTAILLFPTPMRDIIGLDRGLVEPLVILMVAGLVLAVVSVATSLVELERLGLFAALLWGCCTAGLALMLYGNPDVLVDRIGDHFTVRLAAAMGIINAGLAYFFADPRHYARLRA